MFYYQYTTPKGVEKIKISLNNSHKIVRQSKK